jgi:transcriptional regulator with XRE-family HTH domain
MAARMPIPPWLQNADPTMASIRVVQCFLARKAVGWSLRDLARTAELASGTVRRFECGGTVRASTLEAIQHTLEKAGVILIDAKDGGPGARLRN